MTAVEARTISNGVPHIGLRGIARAMRHRPDGVLQGTRWLFTWLALLSLLFSVPGILPTVSASPEALVLATAATLCLWASLGYGFLRQRVPIALEILDAVALTAFALATAVPLAATPLILAFAWQRTLYGSRWTAMLRGALYTGAVVAVSVLWAVTPEHTTDVAVARQGATISIMLLTILVAGQLRSGLKAHDWAIERDKILAATGASLLGLTNGVEIRTLAWNTAATLGASTPGLRVLKVAGGTGHLTVGFSTGHFDLPPATLPLHVLAPSTPDRPARIVDPAPLDAAAGSELVWECIPLTEQTANGWLLVGAPKRIPEGTLRSVRSLVNQVNLALRNSDAHHQLLAQAQYDALTGLENRLSFTSQLSAELARADASTGLHVLFLDLDDFKDINDQMGHRAGDAVLIEVAERLRRCIRPQDICARLGGDEFAVVLMGTADATATAIAERMVESLAVPFLVNGLPSQVGASVGVTSYTPGVDVDDLVHQADVAMYAAKAHGKGRVQVFLPGLLQAESPAVAFERQLGRAAGKGELVVHYQPIVSLTDLTCTGAEALVRWEHPDRGLLLPGEFIGLAETTGAILSIGAFMLRRACADAATWPAARPGVPMTVHVNISARELESDHFVDSVLWCLAESGLPANRLVLELTETVVLESVAAVQRLKTLAAHGIHIAIDDFGTGYSSLSTLRTLPITVVKLDSSFVAGALSSAIDRSVVEAIVQMAAKLGITTVAEGVEVREQQELLRQIGTDEAQGYLYSRPAPLDELLAWLAAPTEAEPAAG